MRTGVGRGRKKWMDGGAVVGRPERSPMAGDRSDGVGAGGVGLGGEGGAEGPEDAARWLPHWGFAVAGIGVLAVWYVAHGLSRVGTGMGDFRHFYGAARAMLRGEDVYASGDGGYIYPPLLAFLYMPFGALGVAAAAQAMLALNVGLWLASLGLASAEAVRRAGVRVTAGAVAWVALGATLLMEDKVKGELQMWQTDGWVLLAFVLGLRWMDRRPSLAGAALGFAFNIKYLPVAGLAYLVVRRRWRAAGAFVASAVVFALLPAVWEGPSRAVEDLGTAYAGVARLCGFGAGAGRAANIFSMDASLSVSVTSALSRLWAGESPRTALGLAAGAAAALAGAGWWAYRRAGAPLWAWPGAGAQAATAWSGLVLSEWAAVVAGVLMFGPQTNTRHLYLALLVQAAAGAMALAGAWGERAALGAGMMVAALGMSLPPGGQSVNPEVLRWHAVGGPSWCLGALAMTVVVVGARRAGRALRERGGGGGGAGVRPTPR
jgi:hypothetical protein